MKSSGAGEREDDGGRMDVRMNAVQRHVTRLQRLDPLRRLLRRPRDPSTATARRLRRPDRRRDRVVS